MLRQVIRTSIRRAGGARVVAQRAVVTSAVRAPVASSSSLQERVTAQHHVGRRREYATTSTMKFKQAPISESEYHELADNCLDALTDSLEALVEEYDETDADEYEVEFASGVLNLRLGQHGTYVINKQPPNKQIWFSSPRSGPKRFDYDAEHRTWFMLKDGEESDLQSLLDVELSDVFGKRVKVDLGEE